MSQLVHHNETNDESMLIQRHNVVIIWCKINETKLRWVHELEAQARVGIGFCLPYDIFFLIYCR